MNKFELIFSCWLCVVTIIVFGYNVHNLYKKWNDPEHESFDAVLHIIGSPLIGCLIGMLILAFLPIIIPTYILHVMRTGNWNIIDEL